MGKMKKEEIKIINQILSATSIRKDIWVILSKLFNKGKKFIKKSEQENLQ